MTLGEVLAIGGWLGVGGASAARWLSAHRERQRADRYRRIRGLAASPPVPLNPRRPRPRLRWPPAAWEFGAPGFVAIAAGLAGNSVVVGAMAYAVLWAGWRGVKRLLHQRRRMRLRGALPHFLDGLAASLRAGASTRHAVNILAEESPEPLGALLREAISRQALGVPLDDSLSQLGQTENLAELQWLGTVLRIHRQTGSSLVPLLEALLETMRGREQLERDIRAMTAQGRMSAWVLGLLVPALAAAVSAVDPGYWAPLRHSPIGWVIVAYAAISWLLGMLILRRMVSGT